MYWPALSVRPSSRIMRQYFLIARLTFLPRSVPFSLCLFQYRFIVSLLAWFILSSVSLLLLFCFILFHHSFSFRLWCCLCAPDDHLSLFPVLFVFRFRSACFLHQSFIFRLCSCLMSKDQRGVFRLTILLRVFSLTSGGSVGG
uniref:Transmembrane protein n=2 Tax=Cacopsylla melanoneura TaxID=428564 RepID=A0A8D8RYQ7_9HEMI